MSQKAHKGILKFYRDKRSFFSLLVGIAMSFITTNPFVGFVSYVLSVIYLDWMFFTQEGLKDSKRASEDYFTSLGITPQQMDEFNEYMVKVRRIAFAIAVPATAASILFFPKVIFQVVFIFTYLGFNFGLMIIAHKSGKIIWPYQSERQVSEDSSVVVGRLRHYDPTSSSALVNPFFGTVSKSRNHLD